jgi:hypothetical protein
VIDKQISPSVKRKYILIKIKKKNIGGLSQISRLESRLMWRPILGRIIK